ncbi:hypothetical protein ES705_42655 [subsurface metagenome]
MLFNRVNGKYQLMQIKRNAIITMLTLLLGTITVFGEVATKNPALQPPDINMAPGPEYADNLRRFQGIPGIHRLKPASIGYG